MFEMIVGLAFGAAICLFAGIGVHKIAEYGRKIGLVEKKK